MDDFQKKIKATFTETEASREISDRLQRLGMVYLVAGAGDGKTSSSLSVLDSIQRNTDDSIYVLDGFDVLKQDISSLITGDWKCHTYIFVDDIFGKTNAISRADIENSNVFEQLQSYIEHGRLRLLVTMRKGIFKTLRSVLDEIELFHTQYRIDLTEGDFLVSSSKRKEILTGYLDQAGIKIGDELQLDRENTGRTIVCN